MPQKALTRIYLFITEEEDISTSTSTYQTSFYHIQQTGCAKLFGLIGLGWGLLASDSQCNAVDTVRAAASYGDPDALKTD